MTDVDGPAIYEIAGRVDRSVVRHLDADSHVVDAPEDDQFWVIERQDSSGGLDDG